MLFTFLSFFTTEVINLLLYCAQQFGMALGVGGETIVLLAYLISIRDGILEESEERFAKAAKAVTGFGIFCIIASGAGVTLTHYLGGQTALILEPASLFKWSLVAIVFFLRVFNRGITLSEGLFEGFSGASWYALFLVHILAPVGGWGILGVAYGAWLVGFVLIWMLLVFLLRGNPDAAKRNIQIFPQSSPGGMRQSAYLSYQPIHDPHKVSAAVVATTLAAAPVAARSFSSAPSASVPPAPPLQPTPLLGRVQVMPRSPNEVPQKPVLQ